MDQDFMGMAFARGPRLGVPNLSSHGIFDLAFLLVQGGIVLLPIPHPRNQENLSLDLMSFHQP